MVVGVERLLGQRQQHIPLQIIELVVFCVLSGACLDAVSLTSLVNC